MGGVRELCLLRAPPRRPGWAALTRSGEAKPKEVFVQTEQDSREGTDYVALELASREVHRESRGRGWRPGELVLELSSSQGRSQAGRDRTTRVAVRRADFPFLEGGLAFWFFSVLQ